MRLARFIGRKKALNHIIRGILVNNTVEGGAACPRNGLLPRAEWVIRADTLWWWGIQIIGRFTTQ